MTEWNQFRGDRANGGRRADLTSPTRPDEAWTADLGSPPARSPVLDRDAVYVGTERGNLYAFDRRTGRRRWVFETIASTGAAPVVTADLLWVGTADGTVHALDPATGEESWRRSVSGAIDAPLAVDDGVLYVGHHGGLTAFDAETGDERWFRETAATVTGAPAVGDGTIYLGTRDEAIRALEVETGDEKWSAPIGGSIVGGPAIVSVDEDARPSDDGNRTSVDDDRTTGDDADRLSADDDTLSGDGGDRVYAADDGGLLIALDADTGQSWFTYEIDDPFTGAPIVVDDAVFAPAEDGYLHVTDTTFGRRKLRGVLFSKRGIGLDGTARVDPIVVGDVLCLGDSSGALYGIDAADFDFRWHYPVGAPVSSTLAVADGALYVGYGERLSCLAWGDEPIERR